MTKFKLGDIVYYRNEPTLIGVIVEDDKDHSLIVRITPFIFSKIIDKDWALYIPELKNHE